MSKPIVTPMLHPTRAALLRGSSQTPGGGVVNFMSWQRLGDELKKSGAILPREQPTAFVVEDGGISIYLQEDR